MIKNTFFFNNSKKAIASLTADILILVLMIGLFLTTFGFYSISKDDISFKNKELEVLNSVSSFRSSLIDITLVDNSSLNYTNTYDPKSIVINLNNKSIIGLDVSLDKRIEVEISSLGILFCSNYNFSPIISNEFNFNGSCVSMITN